MTSDKNIKYIILSIVLVIFICSGPIIELVRYLKFIRGKTKGEIMKTADIALGMRIYSIIYLVIILMVIYYSGLVYLFLK